MKRYIDERRRQQAGQTRQLEALRKSHQEQFDKLNQEMDRVSNCCLYPALYCGYNCSSTLIQLSFDYR